MKDYTIVRDADINKFCKKVTNKMNEGYVVHGDVFAERDSASGIKTYFQVMICDDVLEESD